MLNDPNLRTTFIPLLLRLTLAAIFVYHGVTKVSGAGNDWGATWATNTWQSQQHVPQEALYQLERGVVKLRTEAADLKNERAELQAGDREANKTKLEENETKLIDNQKKQEDLLLAENRIKAAFSAATTMPEALSHPGVQLAVAWGELACGVAMLLGLFTRIAAVGIIIIMAGAIYIVTGAHGFSNPAGGGGYEYNLAILAMCVVLIIKGSGPVSVDGWFRSRRKATAAAQPQQPVTV